MPSVTPSESSTMLTAVVDDESGNAPTVAWQQVSSFPSGLTAMIASPASAQTAVTFDRAGIYTFRVTATDAGGLTSSDDVDVWVNTHTLGATHDAMVGSGQPNVAMGVIENAGPWVNASGQCNGGAYSRGYFRFDVRGVPGSITAARLRLPRAEATPNTAVHHDFYLSSDAQDDWNGANASTDWEATVTYNNQSVTRGLASNLQPQQMIGTYTHDACVWRHGFVDPSPPDGPGSDCPGWIEANLDVSNVGAFDSNREWSIFMSNREACMNGLQVASRENLINPTLVVIESWQTTMNLPPVANAGRDQVVTDTQVPGTESVTFDGSASTDDSGIVTYAWRESGQLLGSGGSAMGVTAALALGIHDIELTVTDGSGLTATDTVRVIVEDRYYPNRNSGQAALIDGDASGKLYSDLFAYTPPGGDLQPPSWSRLPEQ